MRPELLPKPNVLIFLMDDVGWMDIRHIPVSVPLMAEVARYQAVLKKFPKDEQIGFRAPD